MTTSQQHYIDLFIGLWLYMLEQTDRTKQHQVRKAMNVLLRWFIEDRPVPAELAALSLVLGEETP